MRRFSFGVTLALKSDCSALIFSVTCLLLVGQIAASMKNLKAATEKDGYKYSSCKACRNLVDSFKKGMEKTARGKFEGGDTHWEEAKLGKYASSEVRLTEIQELLCQDLPLGIHQCMDLASEHEGLIEEWWFLPVESQPTLEEFLCIDKLKVCCPAHHFGPDCLKCPGDSETPCSGHGKCKGDGTRKGNGQCQCDAGYKGDFCTECDTNTHYESYKDNSKLLCSPCHAACKGPCTGPGPQGCKECHPGWVMYNEKCVDVDECIESETKPCDENHFCVNNEGSFSCISCDKSCKGCLGDGPDTCVECADGYHRNAEGICIDLNEESASSLENGSTSRNAHGQDSSMDFHEL